jgi:DNA-binding CsgD family transcriptional regulator
MSLWRALLDGRWSLVDCTESDGRRVVLARRNEPGVRDPRALAPRERDVLAHVALGHSNKYIAYLLGIATSTVATHLASAMLKIGLRSRRDAIAMFRSCGGPAGHVAPLR